MHRAAVPARARRGLLRPLPAMDLPFLILVLTLVGFGLVMLYSASSAVALYRRGDAWAYVRPQLLYAAMGIGAMWAASRVDYHIYHKLAWPLLALSLVLLVVVLFMPEYNGCKRWLVLPGLGTLQPSEIAKFAVVLVFAHIISLNHSRMESFAVGVVPFALVLGAVAVLMLLEPHLSGTVLILGIGAVLMFVGGTGLRWFVLAGVGGAAHEHQHGTDAQNEQCARKMWLQQHQRRHHAQHQRKGQHPHGKALHPVVVERDDVGKHQHYRKFCDLTGLQGAQPRQHQPPLAAVVLRHEQHRRQQEQRNAQKRPRQFVEDVVIHPAGKAHPGDAQRRIEQLRAEVGEGIAPSIERHSPRCAAQHHQPKAHQREHQHQKRQVRRRQRP